ncbi:MAG: desulfoferrodoxin family protein [Erysipelotrichaceae bacterium]|nr:desulfoferrodoxin family protein [Erysipelotrichaceae bacterium]
MQKFYRCNLCGNLIGMVHDSEVVPVCCGEPMQELIANTTDAANEKHVPVIEVDGSRVKVTVGSVLHPMIEAHHIAWIYLLTKQGGYLKYLHVEQEPIAYFCIENDEVVAAFEYCNLHGLWKSEV